MTTYNEGDRIVLEHEDGSKLVRDVIVIDEHVPAIDMAPKAFNSTVSIGALEDNGWSVTAHTPKLTLPTEWGVYIVKGAGTHTGPLVFVHYGDSWRCTPGAEGVSARDLAIHHQDDRGLERLVPESEVSARVKAGQREVVEFLRNNTDFSTWHNRSLALSLAGEHFGLSEDGAE